jgi:hypothetical protein
MLLARLIYSAVHLCQWLGLPPPDTPYSSTVQIYRSNCTHLTSQIIWLKSHGLRRLSLCPSQVHTASLWTAYISTVTYRLGCQNFQNYWRRLQPPDTKSGPLQILILYCSTYLKPEAATAVIELLMMGGKTPETRWAVNKRQDHKIKRQTLESQNTTIYTHIYIYIANDSNVCVTINEISSSDRSYILYCTAFSLNVQPDDGLLEAETCSC